VVEPDGRVLGVVRLPEIPANIAFGGENWSTIFLPARTSVYALETTVRGLGGSRAG
jgi:gluconolactonase